MIMEEYGYHKRKIEKGVLREFSKIREEFDELTDAHEQDNRVLEICELCDLLGAIKHYASSKFCLSIDDLLKFTASTERAFECGKR